MIVLAVRQENDRIRVRVAPITHTPPHAATDAIEIPFETGQRLGLDDARSWVITRETNVFTWPGPDIRPADKSNDRFAFGLLAGATFRLVRDSIIANSRMHRAALVERDE